MATKQAPKRPVRPKQHQSRQPGLEAEMHPRPQAASAGSGEKLCGRVVLITGGDSGIGGAVT